MCDDYTELTCSSSFCSLRFLAAFSVVEYFLSRSSNCPVSELSSPCGGKEKQLSEHGREEKQLSEHDRNEKQLSEHGREEKQLSEHDRNEKQLSEHTIE